MNYLKPTIDGENDKKNVIEFIVPLCGAYSSMSNYK